MRGATRQRPVSHHGAISAYAQAPAPIHASRKIFNCIVDDTALVAGVKRSTRNGIRQWVKNGQIRLFVPLHALDQLSKQKLATSRHGDDVRETLQWLDDATTKYPHAVTLQGGDQYYSSFAEVERFAVPRTLFSENDHMHDDGQHSEADALAEQTEAKLSLGEKNSSPVSSAASVGSGSASPSSMQSVRSSVSPVSPPTSPTKAASSPAKPLTTANRATAPQSSASASVPIKFQPLFNYILWRIHQELDPIAALESFIFLCNDPNKVHHAKGFDIRCKRLEQLREAVGREDRDFRNRQSMHNRENQPIAVAAPTVSKPQEDDDDEVVYKPAPRGPAAMMQPQPTNVIDPNAFGRSTLSEQAQVQPKSPRFNSVQPRGGPTTPIGARGNNTRGNFRGGSRGRSNFTPGRGGFVASGPVPETMQTSGQIDPDSFTRPRGSGYTGRGGRKLWVPT